MRSTPHSGQFQALIERPGAAHAAERSTTRARGKEGHRQRNKYRPGFSVPLSRVSLSPTFHAFFVANFSHNFSAHFFTPNFLQRPDSRFECGVDTESELGRAAMSGSISVQVGAAELAR